MHKEEKRVVKRDIETLLLKETCPGVTMTPNMNLLTGV